MKNDDRDKTPEELLDEFLLRQVEEGLDFESFVAEHPEHRQELYRLIELVPIDLSASEPSSLFYSPPTNRLANWSSDFSPGNRISGFELVRPLGRGGMGEVWEAYQETLDRNIALKFIRSSSASQPYVDRFHTEAKAGGRLNHPNVISVYDHGNADGRHWISQELIENGCTLADTIAKFKSGGTMDTAYYRRVAHCLIRVAAKRHCPKTQA